MPAKVKLIIDKDLGHVLAAFTETVPREPELTVPELLGTKLPVRSTSQGMLEVSESQLALKDIQIPSAESPVTQKQLLEEPRKYLFGKQRVVTEPETLFTSNNVITAITLVKEITLNQTQELIKELIYIRAELSSQYPENTLVTVKAFAQARGEPGPPQLYESIYGESPGIKVEKEVVNTATNTPKTILCVKIPLTLLEDKQYDVLVLLNKVLASVAEGLPVTTVTKTTTT